MASATKRETHQTVSVSRYRSRYATTSFRISASLSPSKALAAIDVCLARARALLVYTWGPGGV